MENSSMGLQAPHLIHSTPLKLLQERHLTARKPHLYSECAGEIPARAPYVLLTAKWDGRFARYCLCSLEN